MELIALKKYGQCEARSEACGQNLNLAQLRAMGAAVLDTVGIEGLAAIILRELEVFWENAWHEVTLWRGADLFKGAVRCGRRSPYPSTGNLRRIGFDLYSFGQRQPVRVVIPGRGPVRVSSLDHADVIGRWLEKVRQEAARGLVCGLLALMVIGSGAVEVPDEDGSDDDGDGERHGLVERPRGAARTKRYREVLTWRSQSQSTPGKIRIRGAISKLRIATRAHKATQRNTWAFWFKTQRSLWQWSGGVCRLGSRRHSRFGNLRYAERVMGPGVVV